MDFQQFDVSKYKEYKDYWLRCDEYSSDMSFVILWAWKDFFGYEIAWEPELLWMRQTKPDLRWLAPAGSCKIYQNHPPNTGYKLHNFLLKLFYLQIL
nr:hypothetical protein [Schwartzia sp. (in: firmicutes)]